MVMENTQETATIDIEKGPALLISDAAATTLVGLLQEREMPGHGLRVFVRGMGCSGLQYGLAFDDKPEETDIVIETHGIKLYLDQESSQYMWGSEIDFVETPQGGAFSINNPNAASACGSGGCSGCG